MVEHKRRTGYATAVTLAASVLFCLVSTAGAVTTGRPEVRPAVATSPASAQAQGGSIALSGSPGTPAINLATNTIYVPIQCPQSYCPTKAPSYLVDIVNAATCNTRTQSRCRVVATAPAGTSPLAALVDDRTDTVYLPDVSGTVSVLDGSHCNAAVTSGCGKDIATIKVGGFLVAAAFDPRTRTLYVANPQGHVFVINTADCNSSSTSGCRRSVVAAVKDGNGPQALDVDSATDTVYTADDGTGNGDTVSVIDGATCNRTDTNGCDVAPHTVTVGSGAFWVAVDQTNDTVYAANFNDGSVSVINGARCNASVTLGCGSSPKVVHTGAGAAFVMFDPQLHTLFTVKQNDDTLSEINTDTCNGAVTSGCPKVAPDELAAPQQGPDSATSPNAGVLVPQTDTAYLVNVGGSNFMSVVSFAHCNAVHSSGCQTDAPSVP